MADKRAQSTHVLGVFSLRKADIKVDLKSDENPNSDQDKAAIISEPRKFGEPDILNKVSLDKVVDMLASTSTELKRLLMV